MFNKNPTNERPALENEINDLLIEIGNHPKGSPEYVFLIDQLERLYKLRIPNPERKPVSGDALVAAGANLAGILLIINFERLHVIGSKALSFVIKTKL